MSNKQLGFSLIELLIVVLIIGIVATVAIPNLLAARRSANEGSAISSLRALHSAQLTYITSAGGGSYAGTIDVNGDTIALSSLRQANLIDDVLGLGTKSGYNFVGARTAATDVVPATFFFSATPVIDSGISQTGTRRYCVTQQGVIGFDWNNLLTPFTRTTVYNASPVNPS